MTDIQREIHPPDEPRTAVNGHRRSNQPILRDSPARDFARETTRYLSAATHTDLRYADAVVRRVMGEPYRALAPTFGVDVVAVTKWALAALRRRAQRDLALNLIVIVAIPLAWLWSVWIATGLALLTGWMIICWERWVRLHSIVVGKMMRGKYDQNAAPLPSDSRAQERLKEVEKRRDGNLVVFRGHSAFPGSGQKLFDKHVLIDASKGKEDKKGNPGKPIPFTSQDLHHAIIAAVRETNLAEIRVDERLFVNGLHIHDNPELLPDRQRPPKTSVDKRLLHLAALHPTPDARAYVCAEIPGWNGQLVVTMFAHAVHTGGSLFIEWNFRVLPPLRSSFLRVDDLCRQSNARQLLGILGMSARETIPGLLGAPFRSSSDLQRPITFGQHRSRQYREISRGYAFDYGALPSIREHACGSDRHHYFLRRDEQMYVLLVQEAVLRGISSFLEVHNVDLGQFESQAKIIFNQTINNDNSMKVGNVTGSGNNFGHGSRAHGGTGDSDNHHRKGP